MSRTVCVYFRDLERGVFGHVTTGEALDWFTDPFWKGPRPSPDTVLEVSLVGMIGVGG